MRQASYPHHRRSRALYKSVITDNLEGMDGVYGARVRGGQVLT